MQTLEEEPERKIRKGAQTKRDKGQDLSVPYELEQHMYDSCYCQIGTASLNSLFHMV